MHVGRKFEGNCRCDTSSASMDVMYVGSGYLAACMGTMIAPNGHVLGIEQHDPLAQRSIASMRCSLPRLGLHALPFCTFICPSSPLGSSSRPAASDGSN